MNLTHVANDLLNVGLSVIPIKMPEKQPTVSWEQFQSRLPAIGELRFNGAMALMCGKISGNVEAFDIDTKHDIDGTLKKRILEVFGDFWAEIKSCVVIQKTISGGYHFIYRCEQIEGNKKLAFNKNGEIVLETRGEGGYIVIAPTPGYSIEKGDLLHIPYITAEQRQKLFSCARLLNEFFTEQKIPTSKKIKTITGDTTPWKAYDQGTDVSDLLQKHGWTFIKNHGKQDFWKRPGNTDSVWSGSWHEELGTFYVYTSSAPPLEAGKAYTPSALLTYFEFGGDFSECARNLLKQGFGVTQDVTVSTGGNENTPKVLTKIEKLENWLTENYDFKRNSITSRVFCRLKGENWDKCNENEIWRQVQLNIQSIGQGKRGGELNFSLSEICTIINSKFITEYNPIHDYFKNLPPWDGQDHITNLASYVTTTNQDFWLAQFKKAMVRMIACSTGFFVNRIVMTLVSEAQELGKSQFIRFLCPPQLRDYYKEEPLLHDKDSEIALSENFLWNLEELDDLNRKEISEMKAIISRESIKQRRAYARHEEQLPRIVNFWGSTNKIEFLTDVINTRWLCFNVLSIDYNYNNTITGTKKIDINKVWAQAYALYHSGFNYELNLDDRRARDTINRDFETMPEEKQLIIRHFLPGSRARDNESKFMMNCDIKNYLQTNISSKSIYNENNIGRAMKQLGFPPEIRKVNGKTVRGYWVKTVSFGSNPDPDQIVLPI